MKRTTIVVLLLGTLILGACGQQDSSVDTFDLASPQDVSSSVTTPPTTESVEAVDRMPPSDASSGVPGPPTTGEADWLFESGGVGLRYVSHLGDFLGTIAGEPVNIHHASHVADSSGTIAGEPVNIHYVSHIGDFSGTIAGERFCLEDATHL